MPQATIETVQALQNQFTLHMRDPAQNPAPTGLEDRRLKIYRDLLYNNIEGFLSGGFPICRKLLSDGAWHGMARDFMRSHYCSTPYFPRIAGEFMDYLQSERAVIEGEPAFFVELAHYEWVEVALDTADEDLSELAVDRSGDLLTGIPVVSPLAWSLMYQYPVHQIGPGFQPDSVPEQPSFLIVYRNTQERVKFMEANAVTARLLAIITDNPTYCGRQALKQLGEEIPQLSQEQILSNGQITLDKLRRLDIILGTTECGGL